MRHRTVLAALLASALLTFDVAAQAPPNPPPNPLGQVFEPREYYGDGWYRSDGWGGEYPTGFTVLAATTLELRGSPDPRVAASIPCAFAPKTTYHPWNQPRVASDGLEFITFTRKEDFVLTAPFSVEVYDNAGAAKTLDLKPGDRWTFLAYIGEGYFVMGYDGVEYQAGQDLIEQSRSAGPEYPPEESTDEWLGLACQGGTVGWLLMGEIVDLPAFGPPNITGYGDAADAQ